MARRTAPRRGLARYLTSAVVLALLLAVLSAGLEVLGGFGTRVSWWAYPMGFRLLGLGARMGAAAAVVGLLLAVGGGWLRRWTALSVALLALIVGGVAVGIPWAGLHQARRVPPIHDITTDTANPPQFKALLPLRTGNVSPAAYDGPETARLQHQAYPDIRPARFRDAPARVF